MANVLQEEPEMFKAVVASIGIGLSAFSQVTAAEQHSPTVVLAWDGAGDYGPQTPGTKTAGWQEAIDACVRDGRDLYVQGGWGGRKAIYHVSDTIHIPATQDFRIDGGVYVLNWTGAADDPAKDLMAIDSTMNGEYHFGIMVYGGAGAALRIRPEHPVPIDGFAVVIETAITSQGIADPHPFEPGERKAGAGLVFDGSKAPIVSSRFDFIGGILNFKTCVETIGAFTQNEFNCLHLHTNAHKSALFNLGPGSTQNTLKCVVGVDQGAQEVLGVRVQGRNNRIEINTRGGFPKGNDLLLESTAAGNRIDFIQGKAVFEAEDYMTDRAETPTNEIRWTGGNPAPKTSVLPAGKHSYIQRWYPASLRVAAGASASVKLIRGNVSMDYSAIGSAPFMAGVGDVLQFEGSTEVRLEALPIP